MTDDPSPAPVGEEEAAVTPVASAVVFELDADGRITHVGDGVASLRSGGTDLSGTRIWETPLAFATPTLESAWRSALTEGRSVEATVGTDDGDWTLRVHPTASGATVAATPDSEVRGATEDRGEADSDAGIGEGPGAEIANVLERMTDAVFALDTEWRFTYLNGRAEALIEREADELLGESVWDVFPEAVGTAFEEQYRHAMAHQEPVQFESYYEPLETWFEVRAYPDSSGLSVYFRDASERKARERELERYETILEEINDGVYVVDGEGRFRMVNQRYAEMTGYDREELLGSHVSMVVSEDVVSRASEIDRRMREGETDTATIEAELQGANGSFPAEATFALLESGNEEHRVGVVRDVSERRRRERELERQRENQELLLDVNDVAQRISREALAAESREEIESVVCRGLVESEHYQTAWIGDVDDEGIELRTGAGSDDLSSLVEVNLGGTGGSPVELAHRRDSVQVRQNVQDDPGDPRSELFDELDYRSSLSTPIVHDGRSYGVLTIDSDRAYAFGGSERDVIARMAETIAQAFSTVEHRQRYRSLVDDVLDTAAPVGITVLDEDGTIAWTNEAFESYFGVDSEAIGRDGATFLEDRLKATVSDPEGFVETLLRAHDTANVPLRSEVTVEAGPGRERRSLEHVAVPVETGLYAGGWVDIYSDVTELKASERARHERERMWSTLVSNLPGMVYRCRTDPGWPMEFVSDASEELTGYAPETLETGEVSWGEDVVHPDDAEPLRESVLDSIESGEPFRETYRIRTRSGELRWVWEQGRAIHGEEGETYIEGFVTDVTERQWAQRERRLVGDLLGETATASTFEDALQATVDRICAETEWTVGEAWTLEAENGDGRLHQVAVSGSAPEAFLDGSPGVSFAPGEGLVGRVYEAAEREHLPDLAAAAPGEYPRAEAAADAGLVAAVGVPVVTDGEVVSVLVFYVDEIRAASERLVEAVDAVARQIGEVVGRRRAEAALRESERRFRSLVQEVEDYAIFMLDTEGHVRTWNEGAERIKGYEAGEIIGEHYETFYTEEDVEAGRPAENLERAAESGRAEDEGWRVRKDGSRFWAHAILTAVHDDEGELEGFAKITRDMTERREWEQELERLSRINGVIRRINQALVRAESHDEIEQAICGLLADTDPYVFAWYGEVGSGGDGRIEPRTWAGREEGYLSEVELTADESETGRGPAGRAVREERVVVCEDVETDASFAPWREAALERGYRSTVAVPVTYGKAQYGVLCIYAGTPEPLSEDERAVLDELGETIGHAKNSVFRREGLIGDTATQLTFTFESGLFENVQLSEESRAQGPSLRFEDTISVGGGRLVHYVTAEDFSTESFERFVEQSPSIESYRRIGDADANTYELHRRRSPLMDLLGDYGGRLRTFAVEDVGERSSVVVELPPDVDVREFVSDVREAYPDAELDAQRVVTRDDPTGWEFQRDIVEDLTDKQHEALEAAFYGGYFEWPRESDGESIAEVLGISPSTFHQHLRVGERKVLAALFAD